MIVLQLDVVIVSFQFLKNKSYVSRGLVEGQDCDFNDSGVRLEAALTSLMELKRRVSCSVFSFSFFCLLCVVFSLFSGFLS